MKYKLSLEGQGLARSLGRWGRSSFLLINPKALWGKPFLLYASLGAEEVSASSDMNSPAQVSSLRQHRRKSRFSPTDGLSVATIPSVQYTPLPRARSDSSLTHIWERNLFATLGSAEDRAQKGKQPPTQPVQINSALAEIPRPYPALLQYIFPRNKSPAVTETYPCRRKIRSNEREPPRHSASLLSALAVSMTTCYFFRPQRMILLGEYNFTGSQKKPEPEFRDTHPTQHSLCFAYQPNKAANAVLKGKPLSRSKSPMWNKFSDFLFNQKAL